MKYREPRSWKRRRCMDYDTYLLSRWGNKPKIGVWRSWALHPTRWDSMPCFFPLCPSYSWVSIMIILLVSSFVEMLEILLMPFFDSLVNPFMVTTSTSLNKLSRTYCRILLAQLHIHKIELLSLYTMFLLKFSYTCMVRYIVVLGKNWWNTWLCFMWHVMCEGRPPKITSDTYWWWLHCGKEIYACFLSIS